MENQKETYNIYLDESSIDNPKNKFMIIWWLFMKRNLRNKIREKIKSIQKEYNMYSEIKRTSINKKNLDLTKKVIDIFFDFTWEDFWFHCIVVDKTKVDYAKYHNDDEELAFYKFIYHLLKHKFSYYTQYYLFLDFKQTRVNERVHYLQKYLEWHIYMNYKETKLKHVQAYDSKENIFLQVADLFIGAVGYCYNWYYEKDNHSESKKEIIDYILKKLDKINLCFQSLPSEKKFNIYKIKLWKYVLSTNSPHSC